MKSLRPITLSICTIACILLSVGCGDIEYRYGSGEDQNQNCAIDTIRCEMKDNIISVSICDGSQWVPNDQLSCKSCEDGRCIDPFGTTIVQTAICACDPNSHVITCNDEPMTDNDEPIYCTKEFTCREDLINYECSDDMLQITCKDSAEESDSKSEPIAVIACKYGCSNNECNECQDEDDCNECQGDGDCKDPGFVCIDNHCIEKAPPECNTEGEFQCDKDQPCTCKNGNWQCGETCAHGCNIETRECNPEPPTEPCNEDNKDTLKCSDDGNTLFECRITDEGWRWDKNVDCPFGCQDDACVDKCGKTYPEEDGDTFYICSEDDFKEYRNDVRTDNIRNIIIINQIACEVTQYYGMVYFTFCQIDVTPNLKLIKGHSTNDQNTEKPGITLNANQAIFSTFLVYQADSNYSNALTVENLSFNNIDTTAGALISTSTNPINLKDIELNQIKVTGNGIPAGGLLSYYNSSNSSIQNVTLNDVTIDCANQSYCGGLAGSVSGSNDAIGTIQNVTLNDVKIDCTNQGYCGGLAGSVSGNNNISNIYIHNSSSISGGKAIGGLIGEIKDGSTTMSNINISANDVDSPINILSDSDSAGGLIGNVQSAEVKLDNINIMGMNVSGGTNVGGLIGVSNDLEINDIDLNNLSVNGTTNVGGLLGSSKSKATIRHTDEPDTNNSIMGLTVRRKEAPPGNYIGGIVGCLSNNFTLENTDIELNDISGNDEVGGIIGGTADNNADITIKNIAILNTKDIVIEPNYISATGNYVGGVIGLLQGRFALEDSQINARAIAGANYVGGVIGGTENTASDVTILHVRNEFGSITAKEDYAGGIAGALSGKVIMDDIINHCKYNGVNAPHHAGGFIGELSKIDALSIDNVINEVSFVGEQSYSDASGFISSIVSDTSNPDNHLSNIISNATVRGKNASAFIQQLTLNGQSSIRINNILSASTIENGSDTNDSSGFIGSINSNYSIDNDNGIHLSNIVVKSDIFTTENDPPQMLYSAHNNIFKPVAGCDHIQETTNDYSSYSNSEKTTTECYQFMQRLSNVFYTTCGWPNDSHAETPLALSACGDGNSRETGVEDCILSRDYKTPISNRWFTDYIYQKDYHKGDVLDPNSIPIKPYNPYTATISKNGDIYSIETKSIDRTTSNADAVLDSLNQDISDTKWVRCVELVDPDVCIGAYDIDYYDCEKFTQSIKSNKLTFEIKDEAANSVDSAYLDLLCPLLNEAVTNLTTHGEPK